MKVFIAIPCYDGKIISDCALSIVRNIKTLVRHGHETTEIDMTGCCYVASARNVLVKNFLDSGFDEIIFVDNDLGFDDDAMLKLIESDEDICVGAYPYRNASMGFPIKVIDDPEYSSPTPLVKMIKNVPYVELSHGPTGLMKIKRRVFEKLISNHPEWKYITSHGELYSCFDTGHLFEPGNWYGEDVAFCIRWRNEGGKIYCRPDITFRHYGIMNASGNLYDYYMANKAAEKLENETDTQCIDRLIESINSNYAKICGAAK